MTDFKKKYYVENENELNKFKELEKSSILDSKKKAEENQEEKCKPAAAGAILKPEFDRKLKPTQANGSRKNNYNLRTVYIPCDLISKFLDLSESNTKRNIETCGILAGKLVTLIRKQKKTIK